jgi:hypothetical protein
MSTGALRQTLSNPIVPFLFSRRPRDLRIDRLGLGDNVGLVLSFYRA